MPEYTVLAAASVVATLVLEFGVLRTGLLRTRRYAVSMAIVAAFQVLVDGWLTKLRDPIVLYDPAQMLGLRWPFDIPVEDYLFGFSMVTATMLLWVHAGRGDDQRGLDGDHAATAADGQDAT
jgi:lycopene cyclase domain-containing protein